MAKFVIFLLYFGLLAIQTCCQMNSDPAPGRSPGPPGLHTINGNHGEMDESPTLLLTKDDNDDIEEEDGVHNDRFDKTFENTNEKEQTTATNIENYEQNYETDMRTEFANDIIDTDYNKLSGLPKDRERKTNAQEPCSSPTKSFLKSDDVIIIVNDTVENGENSDDASSNQKIDINLEIQHYLFETLNGINCGLMYKVRLTTDDKGGEHLGEFHVETTSNGRNRGSFVDRGLGNKLPISWFHSPFVDGTNWSNEDNTKRSSSFSSSLSLDEDDLNDNDGHTNGDGEVEGNGNGNGDAIEADEDGGAGDDDDERILKSFGKWNDEANFLDEKKLKEKDSTGCTDNQWDGNFNGKSESAVMWMLNEICEQNANIQFRVFFLPTINETTLKSKPRIVYEKIFTFKIIKDCQLTLRESSGSLDYTMLPLYSLDCTLKFPSFDEKIKFAQPPPGILIELQRLNVPCDSGAYIKLKPNTILCGKFEELHPNDRSHHFDVSQNITLNIYKNPMFSLDYKFVDYCYNLSVNNESAEFFIRQTRRDSLECYFLIHLPYGNQIDFKLVTNNDSELILKTDQITNEAKFYTKLGLSIDLNLINFNNSINNFTSNRHASTTSIDVSTTNRILNDLTNLNINNYNNNNRFFNANSNTNSNSHSNSHSQTNSNNNNNNNNKNNNKNDINNLCTKNGGGGMLIQILDSDFLKWTYCLHKRSEIQAFAIKSKSNTLRLYVKQTAVEEVATISSSSPSKKIPESKFFLHDNIITKLPSIYFSYAAEPIKDIVSDCPFGWIALQQFCIAATNFAKSWYDSEMHCASVGGHLASIRTELQQNVVDQMIINSPGYQNHYAYWVGGSDKNFEGDFRWIDGLPFQYTNWFPGWSQHNNYNKQPNDDGLSSQDCIELRKYFRTPPGIQTTKSPLSNRFMWNDRDCNANNFFICERPIADNIFPKNWINDCNKTVSLTKEHSRASLWSPSFPRQYPDNANCYTTITAPFGYRIVIEFEELVIESEPGCTYDYLDITEPSQLLSNQKLTNSNNYESKNAKSSRHSSKTQQIKNLNNNIKKIFRKRSSYENPNINLNLNLNLNNINSRSSLNKNFYNFNDNSNLNDNNSNFDNAQMKTYQNLLSIFTSLYKSRSNFLIQTPEYPKGNPLYYTTKRDNILPRRLCGDWSSKLKLLRYVTSGSYLGLHFVSDYSHHYGGYKAKAFMENTASECSDERLKPFNGSCYLFASYPEVDWFTAQQVCRGIGAQLASVTSPNEHRFVITNIRNQIDYSPQIIYWLGAELEQSGQFEWTDDTKMMFEGWLPGQGRFEKNTNDSICLGLQWKMSSTPMLPSGLYWESQKCRKTGGYICKKKRQLYSKFELNNETITGTEGRLTSPGYPNSYPLNVDYWIHIRAPERWRIIVQFQKIDLESQDECLYDFISIQNYELVSKLSLEPGTNPIPMAMFAPDDSSLPLIDYESETIKYTKRRLRRSVGIEKEVDVGQHKQNSRIAALKMHMTSVSNDVEDMESKSSSSNYTMMLHKSKNARTSTGASVEHYVSGRFNGKYLNRKRRRRKRMEPKTNNKSNHLTFNYNEDTTANDWALPFHSITKRSSYSRLHDADNAQSFLPYVRWCGSHDSNMSKFDFVSASNEVVLNFHSDYSTSAGGFAAVWKAIDLSGCPIQTLTSREGHISSPNYPNFLINTLNCTYVIQAPAGRKVWLEFLDFDLFEESILEVDIGHGKFQPFRFFGHINEGFFVSYKEQLRIHIRTGQRPRGKGFQAFYRTVGPILTDRIIHLSNNSTGHLYHLNYPHRMAENVDFIQHLVAPLGDIILLELFGVEFSEYGCPNNNILEIYDNYADNNGTKWQLCKYQNHNESVKRLHGDVNEPQPAPIYITSYLNTLYIRQKTTSDSNINLNASIRIQQDINYKLKLTSGDDSVESCQPNPCQYKGKCVTSHNKNRCQCHGHFTGRFCGLNLCELEPCLFGKCELTLTNFKCHCQPGYMGTTCEQKQRPCADNPCESRGICIEKNGGFFCRCHAWWEGARCERRMMHIPYKPLSERMLQEPFWLGLITVFVVLAFIGLVWCAKRHFPEKIEKLLAEEADRNRPPGSIHGHHHHTSLREQLQFTTSIPQTAGSISQGSQRSIFNRLGIRKPSILSLSSPNPPGGATARTFSLDDLLRPPPRRSPSPRKKRNNSTPVKKNAAEKKQILQQLVTPVATTSKPKITIDELVQLSETQPKQNSNDSESDQKETTFSENSLSAPSTSTTRPLIDPKLEKKVTFARLLNKVSAEMSSTSSDVDGTRNSSALSLPTEIQFRPSSVPPSPCTNDIRSPHSTSSNQGSDSLSSSEIALNDFVIRNTGNIITNSMSNARRNRPKVSSADSILAMFRNFASTTASNSGNTTATPSPSSVIFMSPSTTPTVSSPPDDAPGDDDSSTSSMHTPVSFTSGPPDSPIFFRQTSIEVPVLDALNAHKSLSPNSNQLHPPTILLEIPSNGINKCLSPIREMPTPMPSPALTPIMPRLRSNSPLKQEDPVCAEFSEDDDKSDNQISANIFLELNSERNFMDTNIDTTPTDTTTTSIANINRNPNKSKATVQPTIPLLPSLPSPSIVIDNDPPTPEERAVRPRDLIIPTLTVEQPSPIRNRHPMIIFPGSPPPQRASIGETSFIFPNKQQQKRLLKQFEKPTSLDLQFAPPTITVTANMSEMESDVEPMSPANKPNGTSLMVPNPVGMCYLSPFTMCTRADRTISESNLSSSGYSSMASPGPSRCGSNNPLCANEMDEPGSGHPGASFSLHANLLQRRRSSVLASCKENVSNGETSSNSGNNDGQDHCQRPRSDSETLSDDVLLESNDEGIGTDHLDEKQDDSNLQSKEKAIFIEAVDLVERGKSLMGADETPAQMAQLQLPSIVIQTDGSEIGVSPVSSRSESPLSDRAGIGRFSPHFYGRKDQLPFTDSDGLYDFPSSDGKGASSTTTHQRRSNSKKRERKSSKSSVSQSPTKNHLDVPIKESNASASTSSHNCSKLCHPHHHLCHNNLTTRKSPKRRPNNRLAIVSSSSSSESLASTKEMNVRPIMRAKINSPSREKATRKRPSDSDDDAGEAFIARISPTIMGEGIVKPQSKIGRLRAIGNQIRFLRRLEKSIKRRERLVSPSDSCAEENTDDMDSPKATSPLLQQLPTSRSKTMLCRQKRVERGTFTTAATVPMDNDWTSCDMDQLNGDILSD